MLVEAFAFAFEVMKNVDENSWRYSEFNYKSGHLTKLKKAIA